MNVKPLGDRILIKIKESETKTAGGIIFPQPPRKNPVGVSSLWEPTRCYQVKAGEIMYTIPGPISVGGPSTSSSRCPISRVLEYSKPTDTKRTA